MNIDQILQHIERIKKGVSQGHIFKTKLDINRWLELYIFEMMTKKQHITGHTLCEWSNYHAKKNGHATTNRTKTGEIVKLWQVEIDDHNADLTKNQTKLF